MSADSLKHYLSARAKERASIGAINNEIVLDLASRIKRSIDPAENIRQLRHLEHGAKLQLILINVECLLAVMTEIYDMFDRAGSALENMKEVKINLESGKEDKK